MCQTHTWNYYIYRTSLYKLAEVLLWISWWNTKHFYTGTTNVSSFWSYAIVIMLAYIVAQFTGQRQPVVQAGSPKTQLRRAPHWTASVEINIYFLVFFYARNSISHSSENFPGTPALSHILVVTFAFFVFARWMKVFNNSMMYNYYTMLLINVYMFAKSIKIFHFISMRMSKTP